MNIFRKYPRFQFFYRFTRLVSYSFKLVTARMSDRELVPEFKQKMTQYFGSKHCITTSSFRMGLYHTLKILDLPKGTEVLLTPITIPDTINVLTQLGLKPVYVDMSLEDHSICVDDLRSKTSPDGKVLLLTYLSGITPDMDRIVNICKENDLFMIEDFSQNYGADFDGKKLGSWGDVSVGSLSSGKILSSTVGGFILTDDDQFAAQLESEAEDKASAPQKLVLFYYLIYCLKISFATLRSTYLILTHFYVLLVSRKSPKGVIDLDHDPQHPLNIFYTSIPEKKESFPKSFFTYMNSWQSKIAIDMLNEMDTGIEKRRELVRVLIADFCDKAKNLVPACALNVDNCTYYHFPIQVDGDPYVMRRFLLKYGIDSGSYGLNLCSKEEAFSEFYCELPKADIVKYENIFLPINENYTEKDMRYIASVVNRYVSN